MYLLACFLCCLHLVRAVPLEEIMVDMSHTYDENVKFILDWAPFNMTVLINGTQPEGYWGQLEEIQLNTHLGTHLDAPSHFKAGGLDVDRIPLKDLVAPAAVINIADRAAADPDTLVTVEDLQAWESKTGHSLDGMIVLMNSGWSAKWGNLDVYTGTTERNVTKFRCPGFSPEAGQWLVDNRSIKGLGSDSVSIDKCNDVHYPVHQITQPRGIYGLENVANVDKIPIYGATLHVLPMKVGRGSGAPVRIMATYPRVIF